MENITLGQIVAFVVFLVAFVEGINKLINPSKKLLKAALKEEFEPIKKDIVGLRNDIKGVKKDLHDISLGEMKNWLTTCFDDLEYNRPVSDTTKERIYECMEEYTKRGGNGFIHSRFDKLKKENKL